MPQECANCSTCHKFGLPIVLARYAIGLKFNEDLVELDLQNPEMVKKNPDAQKRYKGVPTLTGNFKATDKEGGSAPLLDDGTQYTLRLLRSGFVYVYNEKDAVDKLRCYEVSENGLLTETPPDTPPRGLKEERRDVACAPEKNLMTAGILTIRNADKAGEVWISFSDTKWTPKVAQLHEDREYRKRHMRRVDLSKWMSGDYQQPHTANLHELESKTPLIAEYADIHRLAFSFSPARFNLKEAGINLAKAAEELNKSAVDGDEIFSTPPMDAEIQAIQIRWKTDKNLTPEQRAKMPATAFERLVEEFDRFYDRSHSGAKQNAPYKNKGMILALDDPAGIAQDLNGLMVERQENFAKAQKHHRKATVSACIESIRMSVMKETAVKVAESYKKKIESLRDQHTQRHATAHGIIHTRMLQPDEIEIHQAMLEGDSEEVKKAFDTEWKDNYLSKLANGGDGYRDFQRKFAESFEEYKQKFVYTLAEAHPKWMKSDRMAQYFICNFDPGETGSPDDDDSSGEAKSAEALEQSEGYVELFSRCVGRTGEFEACINLYVEWLTEAPLDEKNLLWRALCLNQDSVTSGITTACSTIEMAQQKLATLIRQQKPASDPNGNETQQEKDWSIPDSILRNIASTWWSIHTTVQEKLTIYSPDPNEMKKNLKDSRKTLKEAQKLAESLEANKEELRAQSWKQSSEGLAVATGEAKARIEVLDLKKELRALQPKIAELERSPVALYNNATGRLIKQMEVPLGRLYKAQNSKNYNKIRLLLGAINGTPMIDPVLSGTPRAMGKAATAHIFSDRQARAKGVLSALPDDPKTKLSARMPGTIDRRVLLEGFLLEGRKPHFKDTFARMIAGDGLFETHVANKAGPKGNIWHYRIEDVERLAELSKLMKDKERLLSLVEQAQRKQADEFADLVRANEKNRGFIEARKRNATEITEQQKELERITKNIETKRGALRESLTPVEKHRRILNEMLGHGWGVINVAIALWSYGSIKDELESLGKRLGPDDERYNQTVHSIAASGLILAGAVVEAAHKALSLPLVSRLQWASYLRNSRVVGSSVRIIGTAASSIASLIFAFWDYKKMMGAMEKGETGWAFAYFLSTSFGVASAAFGFYVIFTASTAFGPAAIILAIAYLVVSVLIAIFEPNRSQQWLESCFFGVNNKVKSNKFNQNWQYWEMGEFKRLGVAQVVSN